MKLEKIMEQCLLPKLGKSFDEREYHTEYEVRVKRLENNFALFLQELSEMNLKAEMKESAEALACVLILYNELLSAGPWQAENLHDYAKKLSSNCMLMYEVEIKNLLKELHDFHNQSIFDACMQKLHSKLTSDDLKKYPSLIEVYCSMIEDVQNYKNVTVDAKALPISLYLIDDYLLSNKKKGLRACKTILTHLKVDAFLEGNYYEVVYVSVAKALLERDLEITKLSVDSFMALLKLMPEKSEFKLSKSEELYATSLEQIQVESNLHRKAILFAFTKSIIELIGVKAVKRTLFLNVVCDNLDASCVDGVAEILLNPVLECLEAWIKNCWCAWKLSAGQKLMSSLLKILFFHDDTSDRVAKMIATLICLSTTEDQEKVIQNLQNPKVADEKFLEKINLVNKYINL